MTTPSWIGNVSDVEEVEGKSGGALWSRVGRELPRQVAGARGTRAARVLVIAPDGTWTARVLAPSAALAIGGAADADIRIEDRAVARRHAQLTMTAAGRVRLTDLGSPSGTWLGDERIWDREVSVGLGEAMYVGKTILAVMQDAGGGAIEPSAVEGASEPLGGAMAEVEALVAKAAPTMLSVLLLGETGAGKDVLAERLHRASARASGPLLRVNCAGLSAPLLESELFGHERGAFTGAAQAKAGLLEVAAGGTVFLDEIGEMPLEVQAKLLLAIEQRVARRVGGTRCEPIDVRFISATHRDLEAEVRRDRFRADFYYRINGLTIRIPPLRERRDEIVALVAQFAEEAARRMGRPRAPAFEGEVRAKLIEHDWPGNVRELRSVVERAVLLSEREVVTAEVLRRAGLLSGAASGERTAAPVLAEEREAEAGARLPAHASERERVIAALAACGGNQSRAARMMGIARNTLIARIRQYGLVRPQRQAELP